MCFVFPESHHELVRVNQKRNQGKIQKISGATTITLGYSLQSHMAIYRQRSSQWVTDFTHCAGQSCPINTIGLFAVVITSRGDKKTQVSPWAPPLFSHDRHIALACKLWLVHMCISGVLNSDFLGSDACLKTFIYSASVTSYKVDLIKSHLFSMNSNN